MPWLWPHKCWGKQRAHSNTYFHEKMLVFPPKQNLFHAGDSSQILFITSLPPASIHRANSSCLCINSCFAFTELHPSSLSFFFWTFLQFVWSSQVEVLALSSLYKYMVQFKFPSVKNICLTVKHSTFYMEIAAHWDTSGTVLYGMLKQSGKKEN